MEIFLIGMVALAFFASPFVLLILHLMGRDKAKKLEATVSQLQERVTDLESRLVGAPETDARTPSAPVPAASVSRDAPVSRAVVGGPPSETPAPPRTVDEAAAPTPAPAKSPVTIPSPKLRKKPVRRSRSSAEWEELIGGSWLNKIGAVVTVVGIALALGYSMRYLGPEGRVALALAMSGAMLAIGAYFDGRERYRVFARGLIGGGWAGLYFTTFAMHGLDAARIIESPVVGTALLVAVAVGMVAHSLLYRSQTVTALAYFVTFGTLAIVPMSRFALFASVPVAASLLYIARRFRWSHMMVAGVVFTYGVYLVRGGSPDVGPEDWAFGQALLFVYWILFEAFDLSSLRWRRPGTLADTLFPINAAGFIGTSLLGWSEVRPQTLWVFFALAAAGFAVSTVLRARLAPPREDDNVAARLLGGGYEASMLAAAVMLLFSIERGFDGWQQNVAWLLEAQLLILGGVLLRNSFVRHLGSAILAVPVVAVIFNDIPSMQKVEALGRTWERGTPLALLTAAVLYADRALLRGTGGVRVAGLEHLYNWVGTLLVGLVLAIELPEMWIAPAWLALGIGLVMLSMSRGASELFLQGYVAIVAAWSFMFLINVPSDDLISGWPARWATALPMVAILYGLAYVRRRIDDDPPAEQGEAIEDDGERAHRLFGTTAAGRLNRLAATLDNGAAATMFLAATLLLSWFLFFEVSGRWLTVAWGLQGVALLVTGFVIRTRQVRLTGLALLGVCIAKLFSYDVSELEMIFRIFSFIILGALLLTVSFGYSRYREEIRRLF